MPTCERTGPPFRKVPVWAIDELASGRLGSHAERVYLAIVKSARLNAPRTLTSAERRIAESIGMDPGDTHRAISVLRDAGLITVTRGVNQYRGSVYELVESQPAAGDSPAADNCEGAPKMPTSPAADRAQAPAATPAAHPLSSAETRPLDLEEPLDPPSAGSRGKSFFAAVRPGLRPGAPSPEVGEQIAALEAELAQKGILDPGEHLNDVVRSELESVDPETLEGVILWTKKSGSGRLLPEIRRHLREHHARQVERIPFDDASSDVDA